ncbi:peptidylprolyl isomerase [Methylococcaceae bacterium CS1]|nr:peptidylprolyl isomerase [Methylococcaceae bacterium CS4]TXK95677.1 peptidylprolyl isomerase [Methylococcaceae bacterium CS5]TXL03947.1 peptidylprolyl isomerase [Methylococcaceae bacterium CS1]TXL04381.1 peptidylprolyl isomerase [Methylococcaceae bacterium CS3]TXL09853.1 peptidylprolyl isomerase [Methylococcaceae bacterium CS2]
MRSLILFLMLSLTATHSFSKENTAPTQQTRVKLQTTLGDIIIELDSQKAPITVSNFLKYIDNGFYNGTIFHRIIPGFMAQGGGFDINLQKKQTLAPIKNESNNGLKNDRATISMARTSNPDSATAQFFINYEDNNSLNYPVQRGSGYAVFGKVVEGMDIVDQMEKSPTGSRSGLRNVPKTNIVIEKALLLPQ